MVLEVTEEDRQIIRLYIYWHLRHHRKEQYFV
jgi:hypothetical protein